MAVRQRGGKYQADVTFRGQRIRHAFDTEAEAVAWEHNARAAVALGKEPPSPGAKKIGGGDNGTMQNVLRAAEKLHWGNKPSAAGQIRNARVFVEWAGPSLAPAQVLTEDKIREFQLHLMEERKVGNATINKYFSAISILAKMARVKVEVPWIKDAIGTRTRYMTEEEVAAAIKTFRQLGEDDMADFVTFLIDTGARPYAEGLALEWGHMTLKETTGTVTLVSKTRVVRTLPLTQRTLAILKARQARMKPLGKRGPFADLRRTHVDHAWRRLRTVLPALEDTVPYTCRHTCCSWQVIKGIDFRRVKDWMGHTTIITTMRYAHLAPNHLLDNLAALEGNA